MPPQNKAMKDINALLEEARADASLLRAALLRTLTDQSTIDQERHERKLAEDRCVTAAEQNRRIIAAVVLRNGAFVLSDAEQKEAWRHALRVQILPDAATGATRFELLEGMEPREIPPAPLAAVPAPDISDSIAPEGTAETSGLVPALHAVGDPNESKEPEPS